MMTIILPRTSLSSINSFYIVFFHAQKLFRGWKYPWRWNVLEWSSGAQEIASKYYIVLPLVNPLQINPKLCNPCSFFLSVASSLSQPKPMIMKQESPWMNLFSLRASLTSEWRNWSHYAFFFYKINDTVVEHFSPRLAYHCRSSLARASATTNFVVFTYDGLWKHFSFPFPQ